MIQKIVAMRGRGGTAMEVKSAAKWNQKLEVRKDDMCNSLTTVSKDNLVLEFDEEQDGRNSKNQTGHKDRLC